MDGIYRWVQNITYYMIFMTAVSNLLVHSKYERYLRFFGGIVLILLVIQPLSGSLRLEERLAYLFESFTFKQDSSDFEKKLWGMEKERLNRVLQSYENAVCLDLEAMARAEGYEPEETWAEIEKDRSEDTYGQVIRIYMRLGPEEREGTTREKANEIRVVPGRKIQVETGKETAKLNAFARKVAGYYGLKGTEVTVEWQNDENQVDSAAAGGNGADDSVLADGEGK